LKTCTKTSGEWKKFARASYPQFNLEDKIGFEGVCNVTTSKWWVS